MNSRQRVVTAINHNVPDKVPIDFGGTVCSTMHVSQIQALRDYYGLPKETPKVLEVYTMIGMVDEELRAAMGVDTAGVTDKNMAYGFAREDWKEWVTPQGLRVLVPGKFMTLDDGKGGYYLYPQGDTNALSSGHMSSGGYYFDPVERQEFFDPDHLKPEDNIEEYRKFSAEDLDYFTKSIEEAYATGRAVIVNFPGLGLGDIADIPAVGLKNPKGIRRLEEWYISPIMRPDYVKKVFEMQMEIGIENLKNFNDAIGNKVCAVVTCGTDFGHQNNTFYSKETFKKVYLPYYKMVNDWIHNNTQWKIIKHSCGAIEPFIPLLIEAGFDAINPVQCSAAGMAPDVLKKKYGKDIVFWGGGVDTQYMLPFGKPYEIRRMVLERCELFSKGGGFIFSSIHNIQANTPVKNIIAMLDAVHEFNS